VIAGFGDTGLLTARYLGKKYDVVGISPKTMLISGRELGTRVSDPGLWLSTGHLRDFEQFRALDGSHLTIIHGLVTSIDSSKNCVMIKRKDSANEEEIQYDALLISSGVTNGFWRTPTFEDKNSACQSIYDLAARIKMAKKVAVVGGGAASVSTAYNLKNTHKDQEVHFFYSRDLPLPAYHAKTRRQLYQKLVKVGVQMHPNHTAKIPEGLDINEPTSSPLQFTTGQQDFDADITIWAIGKVTPNNSFIPAEMLSEKGFVKVDKYLRVQNCENIFAIGDIADTDVNRVSARNWGFTVVAYNINCYFKNVKPSRMKKYKPSKHRWGSILGPQKGGTMVYFPSGRRVYFFKWLQDNFMEPVAEDRVIFGGVRRSKEPPAPPELLI